MVESKLVIKINYDKESKIAAKPKMVTIWHIQRILAAIVILAVLVFMLLYWLSSGDNTSTGKTDHSVQAERRAIPDTALSTSRPEVLAHSKRIDEKTLVANPPPNKSRPLSGKVTLSNAIIYDRKVVRASLNTELKDNEPYHQVKNSVSLGDSLTIELFYFNELKDIKDKVLYHYWSKDGKVVLKKQLDLLDFKDGRAKLVSSKRFTNKDRGVWQIQLIDRKGKVFCKIDFIVNFE